MKTSESFFGLDIRKAIFFANQNKLSHAIKLIEELYAKNPYARDGFAIIGNVYCTQNQYEIALELFERDRICDRLSPSYRHILAYLLSQTNKKKEALSEMSRACDEDPALIHGHLLVHRLSGDSHFHDKMLAKTSTKDKQNKQIKDLSKLKRVWELAQSGQWNEAELHIKNTYHTDPDIQDGYALIGSIHRAFAHYEQALYYYEIDRQLDRLTPFSRLIFSHLLACNQRINEAEKEVLRVYAEDDTLHDGFSLIGSTFRNSGQYQDALPYYERDNILRRISPSNRHIFADHLARAGRFKEVKQHIERGYADNPNLRNGYARIGSILRANAEFDNALHYYELDFKEDRLSPVHRAFFAELLSRFGHIEESLNQVKIAYTQYRSLTDGYSRCAWAYHWKNKEYDKVIELCELDLKQGRLSPAWAMNLAHAHAANGDIDKSLKLIKEAYESDPTLKDGYSRCAWSHFWQKKEYEKIIELCEFDQQQGRLSPAWAMNLAHAHAANGDIDKSLKLVKEAYESDPTLKDGYSRCGWSHFWEKKEYEKIIELCEFDQQQGRLSSAWAMNLAHAHAANGDIDKSLKLVKEAYESDPTLKDGYSRCGWSHFWEKKEYEMTVKLIEIDKNNKRLSPSWMLNYAKAVAANGDIDKAFELLDDAYKANPSLKDGFIQLAYTYALPRKNYAQMLKLCLTDTDKNRTSPAGRLMLAEAYARNGMIQEGETEVANAYHNDTTLKNGYVRIARICRSLLHRYEKSIALCKKDMELERFTDSGRFFLAESQMMLGFFDEALPHLFRIKNMPKNGWAIAARLWANSFQWPIDHREAYDPIMKTFLDKHAQLEDIPDTEVSSINEAIVDIGVMRERLVTMSQRTGIDLHEQLRMIASKKYADDACSMPFPFLNARLYAISASDLLVLFNEIILSESDQFEAASENPYIIDGGANIGSAIAYFKWLYPESRIVAFEPNPEIFEICKRNIELNEWKHITLHPYALSGVNGQLVFHCDRDMPMASTLLNRAEEEGRKFYNVTVKTRTLDTFMDRPVDFLKLDIESAECEVITSLKTQLSLVRSGIIEYHHGSSQNSLSTILQRIEHDHVYTIKEPFSSKHRTGLVCITPRWSRSIFFKKRQEIIEIDPPTATTENDENGK